MRKALHFFAFLVLLALWTWKLLEPIPVPESVTGGLSADLKFILAKTLHAVVYAILTILGITLTQRWKWWLVGFLLLHGVGTEIGQTFVPNRSGSVRDVLIDWVGIGCGVGMVWWFRRLRLRGKEEHSSI
jgi:VanZ family protein